MLKTLTTILALLVTLGGCASYTPDPAALRAVPIQGTPGMGVIYLVRGNPDWSPVPAQVYINDDMLGSTYAGTYFRIEVPPGRHRIRGFGVDGGTITLDVQADRVYFVQQRVMGLVRSPTSLTSSYEIIDEPRARALMVGAQRMG